MAYNGSGGKRLCTGTDLDVERSNGNNYMTGEPRRKREPPARPNHILLYTIINPAYPITVDAIYLPLPAELAPYFLSEILNYESAAIKPNK
ncbi:hypothetical protein PYW08_010473 [Mythimna loreyi]|uniref:Uncharacterized protein n=1 Tax=Mythimna loreyi TaxID=667449 RepID=A0ACC2Q4W6_9NEOP|nr:hypothetical protein PYW08_010473 [Mythimna loreyi]